MSLWLFWRQRKRNEGSYAFTTQSLPNVLASVFHKNQARHNDEYIYVSESISVMAHSEFSVGSGQSVKGAIARAQFYSSLLTKADQEGFEMGPAWDGTVPPFRIGDYAVGWGEAVACLYQAAVQTHNMRGVELSRQLVTNMQGVTPTVLTVGTARQVLDKRASPQLEKLYEALKAIRRAIAVLGVLLQRAHDLASQRIGRSLSLLDPVFLAEVFNQCFVDIDSWNFLEDFNVALYRYNTHYARWMRT